MTRSWLQLRAAWTSAAMLMGVVTAAGLGLPLLFGNAGTQAATLMLVQLAAVLGLALFTGNTGIVSFGHAAIMALGAYLAGILTMKAGIQASALPDLPGWLAGHQLPILAALVLVAIAGAAFGAVSGLPIRRLGGEAGVIATLAVLIITNSLLIGARPLTRGSQTFYGVPRLTTLWLALGVACLFVAVLRILRDTPFGLALRAARDDEVAAAAIGVEIGRGRHRAWIASAAMTAVAGGLYGGFLGAFSPRDFYFDLSFGLLAMLIVGGMYTVTGAVLGCFLLTAVVQLLRQGESGVDLGFVQLPGIFGLPVLGTCAALLLVVWRRPAGLAGLRELGPTGHLPAATTMMPAPAPESRPQQGAALRVEGIGLRFGGVVALDGVSFTVPPGEAVGLIGPNGAGKTTLVNVICGQSAPGAGRVMLGDTLLSALPAHGVARAGLARTFQNIRLFERMTVRENVLVAASMTGDPAGVPALADRELARLRLGDLQHRLAGSLSYGDRRRVEIARALALRPRFLLLDEPAAGMNPAETESLLAMLQAVQRDLALGLIVIEHDLHFITRLCRRIVVLNKGQKIAEGSPEEIRRDPAVIDAYIGVKHADPATTATRSAS